MVCFVFHGLVRPTLAFPVFSCFFPFSSWSVILLMNSNSTHSLSLYPLPPIRFFVPPSPVSPSLLSPAQLQLTQCISTIQTILLHNRFQGIVHNGVKRTLHWPTFPPTHTPPETNSLRDTTSLRGTNTAATLPHYEQKVHTDHARAHCLVSLSLPAPEVQAFLLLIFSLSLSRAIFKPGNLHLNCLLISDKPTLFLFARVVQMHVSENVIASISLSLPAAAKCRRAMPRVQASEFFNPEVYTQREQHGINEEIFPQWQVGGQKPSE